MSYIRNTSVSPYVFPGLKLSLMEKKYITLIKPKITTEEILEALMDESGLQIDQIISKVRKGEYVKYRQIFCHIARKYIKLSYTEIGEKLNFRDHTTVIHNVTQFQNRFDQSEEFRDEVQKIYNRLGIS